MQNEPLVLPKQLKYSDIVPGCLTIDETKCLFYGNKSSLFEFDHNGIGIHNNNIYLNLDTVNFCKEHKELKLLNIILNALASTWYYDNYLCPNSTSNINENKIKYIEKQLSSADLYFANIKKREKEIKQNYLNSAGTVPINHI